MKEEIIQRIDMIKRGKVPPGYKKASIAIIPSDDWKEDLLGNLGDFYKGKGLPGTEMKESGIPCIGYGDIYTKYNFHFSKAQNFVDEEVAKESQPIDRGVLLFTGSGETAEEIGKCVCYNGEETIYAGGDIVLFKTEKVNPLFIAYQQSLKACVKEKAQLGQGHSVVHIYANSLKKLSVVYPKNEIEQKKISEILIKWDKVIDLQETLIIKLETQRKALMQRMTQPKNDWISVSLKKILKERKSYSEKGLEYPHVTLSKEGICDKTEQYNRDFLVTDQEKEYKVTHYNDLCYNPANLKFGVICLNKYGNAIFSPIYVTFEIDEKYDPDFIAAILTGENFINKIRRFEEGTIYERQAVKPTDFIRDNIFVPKTIHEQKKLAKVMHFIDTNIDLQKQKLKKFKEQQNVMMQLLLTGIVRVN